QPAKQAGRACPPPGSAPGAAALAILEVERRAREPARGDTLLRVGLVGLPGAGKSTVFDALVRTSGAQAQAGRTYAGLTPRVAIVKVPDERLGVLAEMYHPNDVTPADVEYHDVPHVAAEPAAGARQARAYQAQD